MYLVDQVMKAFQHSFPERMRKTEEETIRKLQSSGKQLPNTTIRLNYAKILSRSQYTYRRTNTVLSKKESAQEDEFEEDKDHGTISFENEDEDDDDEISIFDPLQSDQGKTSISELIRPMFSPEIAEVPLETSIRSNQPSNEKQIEYAEFENFITDVAK